MEKFTASNGYTVGEHPGLGAGTFAVFNRVGRNMISGHEHLLPAEMDALREYFQHERDQELGRWRWPEDLNYVVYPSGTSRVVLNESTGRQMVLSLHDRKAMTTYLDSYVGAARAYDAAHPETKPWHTPKHLEIWALTIQGCPSEAYIYRQGLARKESGFRPVNHEERVRFSPDDPSITSAKRIWPEPSDG